jgi:hypothetical protein
MYDNWGANPECLDVEIGRQAANPPANRTIKLIGCQSETAASQWLVRSLHKGGIASIALVNGIRHWVTVYGFDLDSDPAEYEGPDTTSYAVRAVYIHDPAPAMWSVEEGQIVETVDPNEAHKKDDKCGQGMFQAFDSQDQPILDKCGCAKYENWGLAYRRIKYDFWKNMVFTGIPQGGSHYYSWNEKYLAVVDVTPPFDEQAFTDLDSLGSRTLVLDEFDCAEADRPSWWNDPNLMPEAWLPDALADPIREIVKQGLRRDGFMPSKGRSYLVTSDSAEWKAWMKWREVLRKTKPARVFPVSLPDEEGYVGPCFYYYLVEMEDDKGGVPAVVMVNACNGREDMLEIARVESGGTTAIKFAPPACFFDNATDSTARVCEVISPNPGPINVKLSASNLTRPNNFKLVWRPVEGSLSPYAPFYEFHIEVSSGGGTVRIPHWIRADFWDWADLFFDPAHMSEPIKTDIFRKFKPE